MALTAGTRIGVYEFTAHIGAGGPACESGELLRELRRGRAVAKVMRCR